MDLMLDLDLIVVNEETNEIDVNVRMRVDVIDCIKEDPHEWGWGSVDVFCFARF